MKAQILTLLLLLVSTFFAAAQKQKKLHESIENAFIMPKTFDTCTWAYYSKSACYNFVMGNYSEAIRCGKLMLEDSKQSLDPSYKNYTYSLYFLGQCFAKMKDYRRAIDFVTKAMEIHNSSIVFNNPICGCNSSRTDAILQNTLAYYNFCFGDTSKAIELGTRAIATNKSLKGRIKKEKETSLYIGFRYVSYATSLACLAHCFYRIGDYAKAIELGKQAVQTEQDVFPCRYGDILENLNTWHVRTLEDLPKWQFVNGDYEDAYKSLLESILYKKHIWIMKFKEATSRKRLNLWKKYGEEFAYLPMFCLKARAYESVGEVYDNSALFAKGLLLNAETSLRDLILESGDTAAVKQFEAMQMTRMTLNRQYEKPIAERKLNCDSLENVAEQMERELVQSSKAYGDFTRNLTISWKDVQKGLSDGDMAVEFISFPKFGVDSILEREGVQYVALTLKKGYDKPKMITLFEESELDAIPENRWYADTALCHLVWGQLGDELRGVKNVYFSPDGALYNIGIEHLPCSATENMGERHNMFRLSSTRELAIGREQPSAKSSALYGGLQYYVPPTELLAYNQKKGYSWRTASRDVFEPLPETKTEVENISALLKGHNYDAPAIYAGDEGTEESFKALSGKRTRIIHLATHGCYITPDEADRQRKSDMQQRLAILRVGNDNALGTEEDEALTRSYLAMSGGKMCWTSDTIPEGLDDGLLTAQEISRLDLRGCDLVVLSACETGLGDITSEGVMGLQRGFKKAGVQSIVMSLWKVADRPTQEFMTEFYRHLTAGEGKRASFLAAQHFLKEKYPTNLPNDDGRPPYWASFIILDPEVR